MDKRTKIFITIGFIALIVLVVFLMYSNKDTLFKSIVKITYPDKCVEEYVNTELVTPECTVGRQMEEDRVAGNGTQQREYPLIWNLNLNNSNLST